MTKIEIKNYDHLKEIEWWKHVSEVKVVLHDKLVHRTTMFNLGQKEPQQSIMDMLIDNQVIKSTDKAKESVKEAVQSVVSGYVNRKLERYNKSVRIYNELVDLDVKDKRTYSCGSVYEGKIAPSEIDSVDVDREVKLSYHSVSQNKVLVASIPCPYDYNWNREKGQSQYIYKEDECIVVDGAFDLELHLTFSSDITHNDEVVKIPNPKLSYNLVQRDNTTTSLCLIGACRMELGWNKGKHKWKLKFQSYSVNKENSREVGLNTFIIYCREQNSTNRESFLQEVKESINKDEMMKKLKKAYGEENVEKTASYSYDINFNLSSYWGKYRTDAIKVSMKDGSFILYDYRTMVRDSKLRVLGLYDSTYKKESSLDALARVLATNELDETYESLTDKIKEDA